MPLPVLQRHFRLSFFLNAGGGQIQKNILMLKLYHCIFELYKLQRIFLSRRSIMCTSYLKKDIAFRMRGSNTYLLWQNFDVLLRTFQSAKLFEFCAKNSGSSSSL